jgi:hypothetical protein
VDYRIGTLEVGFGLLMCVSCNGGFVVLMLVF